MVNSPPFSHSGRKCEKMAKIQIFKKSYLVNGCTDLVDIYIDGCGIVSALIKK